MSDWQPKKEPYKLDDAHPLNEELFMNLCKRVYGDIFKASVAGNFNDIEEPDYSTLTVKEIMDKIKAFLAQNPSDVNQVIFLNLLAKIPVSMCKRDVSPLLKRIIGFYYRLGVPNNEQKWNGASKVGFDDLSEIFARSKATISECVNDTETAWRDLQHDIEEQREIQRKAKEQLIQEEKERIREAEQEKQKNNQTNERTPPTIPEEDICSEEK